MSKRVHLLRFIHEDIDRDFTINRRMVKKKFIDYFLKKGYMLYDMYIKKVGNQKLYMKDGTHIANSFFAQAKGVYIGKKKIKELIKKK